ncbi:unnamed protein product [Caenorhabditis nigoni]
MSEKGRSCTFFFKMATTRDSELFLVSSRQNIIVTFAPPDSKALAPTKIAQRSIESTERKDASQRLEMSRWFATNAKSSSHRKNATRTTKAKCPRAAEHHCSMMPTEKKESKLAHRRIYFDIESRAIPEIGLQVPVLFMALKCCPDCAEEIPQKLEEARGLRCEKCSPEGRYDGQFILEKLIGSNREASSVSLDGTKLVYLNHRGIRLLDSLKYLTMSLESVAKTFQIESVKGDFPVKFISEENYDHDGNLLGNEFYSLENKSPMQPRHYFF